MGRADGARWAALSHQLGDAWGPPVGASGRGSGMSAVRTPAVPALLNAALRPRCAGGLRALTHCVGHHATGGRHRLS